MSRIRKQTAPTKIARRPAWIDDIDNQQRWNGRFIGILNRDYGDSDPAIFAILSNEKLAQVCAVKIRSYVDRQTTVWLYQERKARGAKVKRQFKIAIRGMKAATSLYKYGGNLEAAAFVEKLTLDLSGRQGRCKEAFSSTRHGRDRAHSTLSECRAFLESQLRRPVTYCNAREFGECRVIPARIAHSGDVRFEQVV